MIRKLLIAYDGSDSANAAIDELSRAGLPPVAEALVLSVAEVWIPPKPDGELATATEPPHRREIRELAERELADARQRADECKQLLRTAFPGWTIHGEGCADTARVAILDRAEAWQPDLIVLGSHGRSAVGRVVLGSVSQSVLQHADCSVRIGRGRGGGGGGQTVNGVGGGGPVRLIVGVDGSAQSDAAVRCVSSRKWPEGSDAAVVTAVDLRLLTLSAQLNLSPAHPSIGRVLELGNSWAREVAERAADRLRESGLTASASVLEGDAKHVIMREAEARNADCIFIGARGLGRVERFLIGSVSSAVAARAHCSVEVVRAEC